MIGAYEGLFYIHLMITPSGYTLPLWPEQFADHSQTAIMTLSLQTTLRLGDNDPHSLQITLRICDNDPHSLHITLRL